VEQTQGTIIITGSSGYIGSALIRQLASEYAIVGLDRPGPPAPPDVAHAVAIDLESDDSVRYALDHLRSRVGSRIASVIHLAAYYDFSGDPSPKYTTVNVTGTERLLTALQSFDVEQFVYASTILVHAPSRPGAPINEETTLKPSWEYPESKLDAERAVARRHGKIPYVIVRMAGIYDEDCHLPGLAQQIQRIYERKLISHVFPGESEHGQASLHLADAIALFHRLVKKRHDLPPALTLLAGEPDRPPSYRELQEEIGRLIHGEPWDTRQIPKVIAKTGAWIEEVALPESEEPFIKSWMIDIGDDHFELDITRARRLLEWEPAHRLLESLPEMIRRLKADPVAFYKKNKLEAPDDLAQRAPVRARAEQQPSHHQGRSE
jgi:nucleoside-diphosphate-sugar epimerase